MQMSNGIDSTTHAHDEVRRAILAGELPPGDVFSQVQLAARLGVSRTPLREALRRLEHEGLVVAEHNRRVRVAPLLLDDFEQVYATRIALEPLAVQLAVPRLGDDDLAGLATAHADLHAAGEHGDPAAADEAHRRFHRGLYAGAGARLEQHLSGLWDHGERYRLLVAHTPEERLAVMRLGGGEHAELLALAQARDGEGCAQLLARHLARTALTAVAAIDERHDPAIVREALRYAVGHA